MSRQNIIQIYILGNFDYYFINDHNLEQNYGECHIVAEECKHVFIEKKTKHIEYLFELYEKYTAGVFKDDKEGRKKMT